MAPTRCNNPLHNLLEEQEVEDLHQEEVEACLVVEVVVEDHQEEALHLPEFLEPHTQEWGELMDT